MTHNDIVRFQLGNDEKELCTRSLADLSLSGIALLGSFFTKKDFLGTFLSMKHFSVEVNLARARLCRKDVFKQRIEINKKSFTASAY